MGKSRRRFGAWLAAMVGTIALFGAVLAPGAIGQEGSPSGETPSEETPSEESPSDASSSPRVPEQAVVASGDVSAQAPLPIGGPVTIMGIDAEDGGVDAHGPIGVYAGIINSLSALAKNNGAGILVLGGGKVLTDNVTEFWDEIATLTGIPVTYSNGAAVGTQSFAGFRIVAVVSGDGETADGGLNAVECQALAARQQDFFDFVNAGGGLLVFAQDVSGGLGCEYAFFGGFGAISFTTGLSYDDIDVTPAGTAAGLSDLLDVFAWHDTYQTFPSFLSVLATVAASSTPPGEVAALGGASVVIPGAEVLFAG
ncbi:MAG: hypothetical protein WD598_09630 [Acidimicrobiia bacterium]